MAISVFAREEPIFCFHGSRAGPSGVSGIGWISVLQRGMRGVSDCLTWMLKDDAC